MMLPFLATFLLLSWPAAIAEADPAVIHPPALTRTAGPASFSTQGCGIAVGVATVFRVGCVLGLQFR